VSATLRVAAADLRWCCDEAWLPFTSTDEVEPLTEVVGQDDAIEALRFGLAISGPGQNIFVRGLPGTGRLSLVRQLLDDIRPTCPLVDDRCYVHNFAQPDRP
jgi:predicted ATPase with chaperone activity